MIVCLHAPRPGNRIVMARRRRAPGTPDGRQREARPSRMVPASVAVIMWLSIPTAGALVNNDPLAHVQLPRSRIEDHDAMGARQRLLMTAYAQAARAAGPPAACSAAEVYSLRSMTLTILLNND